MLPTPKQNKAIATAIQAGMVSQGMVAESATVRESGGDYAVLDVRVVVPAETLAEIGGQPVVKRQIEITVDRQELPPGRQQTLSAAVSALARQAGPPGHQG